jgi:serine/threonine protein kinase
MKYFKHENIISLKDILNPVPKAKFEHVYLVTELMDTDLHQIISSNQPVSDDHIQYFLYQILCAVKYIHSANVLHRDLKPNNILVNKNCDLKVCDFGLSRPVGGEHFKLECMTNNISTIWYRSPELLLTWKEYTKAMDMWAVGCILAELLKRRPLLAGKNYLHQISLIFKLLGTPTDEDIESIQNVHAKLFIKKLPKFNPVDIGLLFKGCNPVATDLVTKLLKFNPNDRLTVDEALNHPFFADIRNKEQEISTVISLDHEFEKILDKEELEQLIYDEMKSFHPYIYEDAPVPTANDEELLTLDLDGTFLYIDHKKMESQPPVLVYIRKPQQNP